MQRFKPPGIVVFCATLVLFITWYVIPDQRQYEHVHSQFERSENSSAVFVAPKSLPGRLNAKPKWRGLSFAKPRRTRKLRKLFRHLLKSNKTVSINSTSKRFQNLKTFFLSQEPSLTNRTNQFLDLEVEDRAPVDPEITEYATTEPNLPIND